MFDFLFPSDFTIAFSCRLRRYSPCHWFGRSFLWCMALFVMSTVRHGGNSFPVNQMRRCEWISLKHRSNPLIKINLSQNPPQYGFFSSMKDQVMRLLAKWRNTSSERNTACFERGSITFLAMSDVSVHGSARRLVNLRNAIKIWLNTQSLGKFHVHCPGWLMHMWINKHKFLHFLYRGEHTNDQKNLSQFMWMGMLVL